jgi:hypothetical protein
MRAHIVWPWLAVVTGSLGWWAGAHYGRSSPQTPAGQTNREALRSTPHDASAPARPMPDTGAVDGGASDASDASGGADNLGVTAGDVPPIPILLDGGLDVDVTTPLVEGPTAPQLSPSISSFISSATPTSTPTSTMVEGTVLDVLGHPVAGAHVFVWIADKPQPIAQSTHDGTFRAWVSHAGVVEFAASHPSVGEGNSEPIRLFAGQRRQGVVVRLSGRQ